MQKYMFEQHMFIQKFQIDSDHWSEEGCSLNTRIQQLSTNISTQLQSLLQVHKMFFLLVLFYNSLKI